MVECYSEELFSIFSLSITDSRPMPLKRRAALFELLLAIASEQLGTSAMKASEGFTSLGPTIFAVIGYVFSLIFFGRCMRILPMGFAYSLWVGLGMITSSLIGIVVFKEALSTSVVIGLAVIAAGILVLNSAQGESI
jgi:small multidrug resistance pump